MKKSRRLLSLALALVMTATGCGLTMAVSAAVNGIEAKSTAEVTQLVRTAKSTIYGSPDAVSGRDAVLPGAGTSSGERTFTDSGVDADWKETIVVTEKIGTDLVYLGTDQKSVSFSHSITSNISGGQIYDISTKYWRHFETFGSMAGTSALANAKFARATNRVTEYAAVTSSKTGDLLVNNNNVKNNGNATGTETVTLTLKDNYNTSDGNSVMLPFWYVLELKLDNDKNDKISFAGKADGTSSGTHGMSTQFSGTRPTITLVTYDKTLVKMAVKTYSKANLQVFLDVAQAAANSGTLNALTDIQNYNQALAMAEQISRSDVKEVTQSQINNAYDALYQASLRIQQYEVDETAYETLLTFSAPGSITATADGTGKYKLNKPLTITLVNSSNKTATVWDYSFSAASLKADTDMGGMFRIEPGEIKTVNYTGSVDDAALYKITAQFQFTFEGFSKTFTSPVKTIIVSEALEADAFNPSLSAAVRYYNAETTKENTKTFFYPAEGFLQVGEDLSNINATVFCYGYYATGGRSVEWYFNQKPLTDAGFTRTSYSARSGNAMTVNGFAAVTGGVYEGIGSNKAYIALNDSTPVGNFFLDLNGRGAMTPQTMTINWGDPNVSGYTNWDVRLRRGRDDQKKASDASLKMGIEGEGYNNTDMPGNIKPSGYSAPVQTFHVFDTTPLVEAIGYANDTLGATHLYAVGDPVVADEFAKLKNLVKGASVMLTTRYITVDDPMHAVVREALTDTGYSIPDIRSYITAHPETDSAQAIIQYVCDQLTRKVSSLDNYRKIITTEFENTVEKLNEVKTAINFAAYTDGGIAPPQVDTKVWNYFWDGSAQTGDAVASALSALYDFAYNTDGSFRLDAYYGAEKQNQLMSLCAALKAALSASFEIKPADYTAFDGALKKAKLISGDPYEEAAYQRLVDAYKAADRISKSLDISNQDLVDLSTSGILSAIETLVSGNGNLRTIEYSTYTSTRTAKNIKKTFTGKYGDQISLTTIEKLGGRDGLFSFIGWYDQDTGEMLSTDREFTATLTGKTLNFIAKYDETATDIPTDYSKKPFKVSFVAYGGGVVDTKYVYPTDHDGQSYAVLTQDRLPAVPTRVFYTGGRWGGADFSHITSDITAYAMYEPESSGGYVLEINGTEKGRVTFDTCVWQQAVSSKVNFYCWVSGVGVNGYDQTRGQQTFDSYKIVSYSPVYNFQMSGHTYLFEVSSDDLAYYGITDTVKMPKVYMRSAAEGNAPSNGAVNDVNGAIVDKSGSSYRLRFIAQYALPQGYTLKEAGMILVKGSASELDFMTPGAKQFAIPETSVALGNVYMMNVKFDPQKLTGNEIMTARAYITYTYKNSQGIECTDTLLADTAVIAAMT